ncbi:MAG: hypothetical protein ACRC8A_09575 [Microcoleaceae cyanobacterium]
MSTVSASVPSSESQSLSRTFRLSPLIRFTLLSLYGALMVPLPFLANAVESGIRPNWLWAGIILGAIALYGALSEKVVVDEERIQVTYPTWVPRRFRQGWSLAWSEVQALKPKTTGQGGLVYYFLSTSGEGYLLPMRVAGFAELVRVVQHKTGIETTDVRPLAQAWMYLILLGCTLLLWLMNIWTISTAISLG